MSTTRTPEEVLVAAEELLFHAADDQARRHAENHLPPGPAGRPLGDHAVAAKGRAVRAELDAAQAQEDCTLRITRAQHQHHLDAEALGEVVAPPASTRIHRVVPVEFVLMGIVGLLETLALIQPVGTILDLSMTSNERFLIPGVVAIIAAILAHQYGVHDVEARRSRVPDIQDGERRSARRYGAAVVGIGAAAVVARAYGLELDAQLSGAGVIAWEGVAFFLAFQIAFALASLALARSYHRRLGNARDEQLRVYLAGLRNKILAIDEKLVTAPERYELQREQLAQTIAASVLHYRNRLAELHPHEHAQVIWSDRTDREAADGSLYRGLLPNLRSDGAAPTEPAPAPANPEQATHDPEPAAANPPDQGIDREQGVDRDLFDAVLDPPV